jgi:hypothetical protein
MNKLILLCALPLLLAGCACGGGGGSEGGKGGECYGNGTCDDGLDCVKGTCVKPGAADDDGEEGTGDDEGGDEGTGDDLEGDEGKADDAAAPLPKELASVFKCLGHTKPTQLKSVSPDDVADCFEKTFGVVEKIPSKGKCAAHPEVVVTTGAIGACSLQDEDIKATRRLDDDYPGVGRVNAIFVDDDFVGFTVHVARPKENRSGSCDADDFVKDAESALKGLGEELVDKESGPDSMLTRSHDGAVYSIHRTSVSRAYGVDRVVFGVFLEDRANEHKGRIPELKPNWFPRREDDIQSAKRRTEKLFRAMGSGRTGSVAKACDDADILSLLGKPVKKVIRDCDFGASGIGFGGQQYWKQWPVGWAQIKDPRVKVHGVGPDGEVMEIFAQIPDPGRGILKEIDSDMGKGTNYGCGGRAWVIDDYVMRVRPSGRKLNLAFVRTRDYDAFSILVPQASVYANWR